MTLDEGLNVATSPESSEEATSNDVTPATRISPPSPRDRAGWTKSMSTGIIRPRIPPAFILEYGLSNVTPTDQVDDRSSSIPQDPFVTGYSLKLTPSSFVESSKLSPTASLFTPGSRLLIDHVSSEFTPAAHWKEKSPSSLSGSTSDNKTNVAVSVPRPFVPSLLPDKKAAWSDGSSSSAAAVVGTCCPPSKGSSVQFGSFSSKSGISRIINITVNSAGFAKGLCAFMNRQKFFSCFETATAVDGTSVCFKFEDIRDSTKAASSLFRLDLAPIVKYMTPTVYANLDVGEKIEYRSTSPQEAEVLVTVISSGLYRLPEADVLGEFILALLRQQGDVVAYELEATTHSGAIYRAEYCNVSVVDKALTAIEGFQFGIFTMNIKGYCPDNHRNSKMAMRAGPQIIGADDSDLGSVHEAFSGPGVFSNSGGDHDGRAVIASIRSPINRCVSDPTVHRLHPVEPYPLSPQTSQSHVSSGRNLHGVPDWGSTSNVDHVCILSSSTSRVSIPDIIGSECGAVSSPRISKGHHMRPRGFHQNDYASSHHNIVDIDRIRIGTDVRTTIMLRNIPNKVDQTMLKDIIDETSRGMYDFMYLRIDFANNCNVGYAFINFEDPYFIIDFMIARAGRRWNRFNSDKVAEISYATIQGRDCLIQKFRNSSVMLEHPSFRPKLFITGTGSRAGEEDVFPAPDNQSKMRRSCDNAQHIGLFAPRAGQAFRDEQRRRSSQYDRGTRVTDSQVSCANYRDICTLKSIQIGATATAYMNVQQPGSCHYSASKI